MIEILLFFLLIKINSAKAELKGYKKNRFIPFTVILIVVGELLGALIGILAVKGIVIYIYALIGAAIGGLVSYLITSNLKVRPGMIDYDKLNIKKCPVCNHENDITMFTRCENCNADLTPYYDI